MTGSRLIQGIVKAVLTLNEVNE